MAKGIDRDALAKRRRQAIDWYREGLSQYRIAKNLGVSFEAVSKWVEAYEQQGLRGLNSLGKPGPKVRDDVPLAQPAIAKTLFTRLFKLIKRED
jgi:transposase-like protein